MFSLVRFRNVAVFLVQLLLVIPAGHAAEAVDLPLVPAQEVHARAGLPNFLAKAQTAGAEVKVGYLGGSITAQAGWRVKSLAWLGAQFPSAKFAEINAAIGGTGSDLGVFRLKQDVLDQQPDLLFVEFAVNDGGAAPEQIYRCMEGIVRQTWKTYPSCDICFVYTITEALVGPMLEGNFPRAASAMEKVADHYGIPSIHMGMEVARKAKSGELIWKAPLPKTDEEKAATAGKLVFSADGVHPYPETGHELYVQAIERAFGPIRSASTAAAPHPVGAPLDDHNYEEAQLVPIAPAMLSAGFTELNPASDPLAKRFTQLHKLYRASQPGQTITFKFRGSRAALYDLVGPDCGQVIVTLDNQAPKIVPRFDAYCTYHRLATLMIGNDLPDTLHTVKIEIDAKQPDKAAILAKNKNTMDKPERFNDTAVYPGAILLVGQMGQ